ncbi:MAG TPA: toll/interleukin-1 receptor domain-containing protein [Pyrinomonadaceae bacterium]|nr:toll/interleukin-1 receptor domain-containing protein [Pyrinomonadaceae bacterium]
MPKPKSRTKKSRTKRPGSNVPLSRAQPYLVFISHSTKDRWIAKQIAKLLEESGDVKTFLDERDIKVGDSIPESIRSNIQQCNEFLVLLTKNSLDRPWVLIEISAAWGHGKRIIAIIDKVAPEDMPEIMLPYKAIDLNDLDEYIRQLGERIKGASQ